MVGGGLGYLLLAGGHRRAESWECQAQAQIESFEVTFRK